MMTTQGTVGNYCRPCGENLTPEQTQCPFCGKPSTPIDEMSAATPALALCAAALRANKDTQATKGRE